jgi:hypothetical protein
MASSKAAQSLQGPGARSTSSGSWLGGPFKSSLGWTVAVGRAQ